ncbi:MAG: protein kinase [Anaerolineales bacterium]|nr:protein kinase [Anaerolineales bacterium]
MNPERIGRYEVIAELGRGGMATVYQAHDPRFKRDVAIKMLPAAIIHESTFRARFEREAQTIAALEYPGIVPVYDFGEENEQPYLVMRYMTGSSLSQRLKDGPLSISETSQIFSRLAAALDYVHSKGIIHRDLKPANILFDQHGNAYLSDFGIARIAEATVALTGDGLIGTPSYMSPEQARGDPDIDSRSDIYALGAIVFEMLTGKQPYEATTPMGVAMKHLIEPVPRILKVKADLPAECENLISRAMAKERDKRFPNATEMARVLEGISLRAETAQGGRESKPVVAPPPPATPIPLPSQPPAQEASPPVSAEQKASVRPVVDSHPAMVQARPLTPPPPAGIAPQRTDQAGREAARPGTPPPPIGQPHFTPPPNTPMQGRAIPGAYPMRPVKKQRGWLFWLGMSGLVILAIIGCITLGFVGGLGGLLGLGAIIEASAPIDPGVKPTEILGMVPTENLQPLSTPVPTLGLFTFADDFSDPSSGWSTYRGDDGITDYENGFFRIFVNVPDTSLYATPGIYDDDVIIEVDATKAAGPDDNYLGVLCRLVDADNFYYLIISSDGYYAIGKVINGSSTLIQMDTMYYSDIIHRGATTNYLRADCIGETLTLYTNNMLLAQAQDSDLSYGDVGLLVGTSSNNYGSDILFDNFYIAQP